MQPGNKTIDNPRVHTWDYVCLHYLICKNQLSYMCPPALIIRTGRHQIHLMILTTTVGSQISAMLLQEPQCVPDDQPIISTSLRE